MRKVKFHNKWINANKNTQDSWSSLPTTSFYHFWLVWITSEWISALRRNTHNNVEFIFMVSHQTNPTMFSYASLKFYSNIISESHMLGHLRTFPGWDWLTWSHSELAPQSRILEGSMHIPNYLKSSSQIMDLFISVFF